MLFTNNNDGNDNDFLKISQQTNIILVFKMSENQCITCFSKKEIINPDHKPILAEFSF